MAAAFPSWLEPMAATLTQDRFTGPEWVFERKFDGIRLLAYKQGSKVRLLSRNRLLKNSAYPSVLHAIADLPAKELILDGEATGVWSNGGDRFAYHVFDVLWLDGRDLTPEPLEVRHEVLSALPWCHPWNSWSD